MSYSDVAILLLEMQAPIIASSRTVDEEDLRKAAAATRRLAEALDLPMFASIVALGPQTPELIEQLRGIEARTRSAISPFSDPEISRALEDCGRRTLAIGGVSSEIAILHTVLDARREGYDVYVLADLCGGLSGRTEPTAFGQMTAAGAVISNISSFFTGLISDMASADGELVMGTLAELWGWDQG